MIISIVSLLAISFVIAILLTPRVASVAERFDLMDRPSSRKVHSIAIPRIGGVAIFIAFFSSITISLFFTDIGTLIQKDKTFLYIFAGGALTFGLGFFDDLKRLGPRTKFSIQIIAALCAYAGGIQITSVGLPVIGHVHLELLSLPITIFWVLLVINAINLIDGLDGLAGGVSFLVCMVLIILSLSQQHMAIAYTLAALAGSILGFLVFNFNPASIFMGDCGSYFIGYMIATLSIFGSLKSHTAFTFLIPIIVLGVPLLDTIWATIRRFIMGQRLFYPDKNHFHHRLLRLGYSHKRAVFVLYGLTVFLGVLSIIMVNTANKLSSYFLIVLGILIFFFIKGLGYFNFFGLKNLLQWTNDLINTLGINRDRRVFFSYQMAIMEASDIADLWQQIAKTADFLSLDYIEMKLGGPECNFKKFNDLLWYAPDGINNKNELYANNRLYMRFPLEYEGQRYGTMMVSKKDFDSTKNHTQTLWRLEFLRRTLANALHNFKAQPQFELYDRRKNEQTRANLHLLRDRRMPSADDRLPVNPEAKIPEGTEKAKVKKIGNLQSSLVNFLQPDD
ncbi:MAG: undecaprenyl/decaprenyl-phosphate alpha-N-acetylglucosaminyl 1-phosphate transferase [Desulfobulbaceae bacterium]|nr:undecaprenyl/decaprenyl-phosphate alpha-N-acetylglucosaminyl 1-phosphate transferase [Desulfobulbaceae bacterium]